MLVEDLSGRKHEWNLRINKTLHNRKKCSSLHKKARELIKIKYPFASLLEEIRIEIYQYKYLWLDFYIPQYNIEVNGEQHFSFNSFFHQDKLSVYRSQSLDRNKQGWCDINNIVLLQFNFDESQEEWSKKL